MTNENQPATMAVQSQLAAKPQLALLLKVQYLEAVQDGFEAGAPFVLVWENKELFPNEESRQMFLKSRPIISGLEPGYDYAVYRVIPESRDVFIGPGDYVAMYSDKHIGCYCGVGEASVVDGKIVIGR